MQKRLHNAVWRGQSRRQGYFADDTLVIAGQHVALPFYAVGNWQKQTDVCRGVVDGSSVRQLFSDTDLHKRLRPKIAIVALLFDHLEQLRVDSIAMQKNPGWQRNIKQSFHYWADYCHAQGLAENHLDLLIYCVLQMVWVRLNNEQAIEHNEGMLESTRAGLSPLIGKPLYQLKKQRGQQSAYAREALRICATVQQLISVEVRKQQSNRVVKSSFLYQLQQQQHATNIYLGKTIDYQVFCSDFDEICSIHDVSRVDERKRWRLQIEKKLKRVTVNRTWLAMQLRQYLTLSNEPIWQGDFDAGSVDGRWLTQLALSQTNKNVFQQPQLSTHQGGYLSILVDCSGSMKSRASWLVCWLDQLLRCADQVGVATQVIGHTTVDWNGGKVYQQWLAKGRPEQPGRLNALRQILIKGFTQTYRQSRLPVTSLLKQSLYKEGLDGEVIQQLAQSMLPRQGRKAILVVSDATPSDSCTDRHNAPDYLSNHLHTVLQHYRHYLPIIGIGIDEGAHPAYTYRTQINTDGVLSNCHYRGLFASFADYYRRSLSI